MKAGFGWALKFFSIALALAALGYLAALNTIGAGIAGVPTPWFGWFIWTIVPYAAGFAWAWWIMNWFQPRTWKVVAVLVVLAAAAAYVDDFFFLVAVPLGLFCIWIWRSGGKLISES